MSRILASQSIVNAPDRYWAAIAQDPTIVKATWSAYFTPTYESNRVAGDFLTADKYEQKSYDTRTSLGVFSGGISKIATVPTPGGKPGETTNTPQFFAGASFRTGTTLKVPDAQDICVARGNGATECLTLPVGEPAKSSLDSLTIEYRHWERNRSIGFNPRFTYTRKKLDGVSDAPATMVRTFEVPVYFMHKVTDVTNPTFDFGSDLIGGVNIGWRKTTTGSSTTSDGPFITLFLTKAFGLP